MKRASVLSALILVLLAPAFAQRVGANFPLMINAVLTAISRAGRVTNALIIRGTAAAWKSGCNRSISATAFRQTFPIAMWPPTAVEAGTAIGSGNGIGTAIGIGIGGQSGAVIATATALIG